MSPYNDLDALVEKLLEKVPEKDRDLASRWILRKRSEGKTVNSIRTYLNAIATLSKMCPGKAITESDTEDVLNLQVKIREKYRNPVLYCHVLRDFLKKGGREDLGVLVSLNSKKSKKDWQDPKNILDRSDVSLMLSITTDIRDKAIIALLWDCGARVHEIASIQLEDLDRQKNVSDGKSSVLYTLWFRKQKVAGEERRIPLYESSSYILKWLRAHPDPKNKEAPLFPSKRPGVLSLTDKAIRSIVTGAGRRAKIGKPTNPHMFRHSRATDLKVRGVSDDAIRAYMGWVRDSDMPMRYISRTQQDQMNEVASKLGYEPMPEPGPVEELEADDLLPPLEEELTEDVLSHPGLVKRLDELIQARVEEQYGNWKTQVQTGELSKAMDKRTDRISVAIKKVVKEIDKTAVVESIEVSFPEVQKMRKK